MPQNIASIFYERAASQGALPIVRFKEGKGPYRDTSWADFARMVNEMAFGLASLGLESKTSAAIFSPTSHLWVAADMAIISNGAFSIPLYPTCSDADAEFILNNSEAQFLFVANESLLKRSLAIRENLPNLKKVILMAAPSRGRSLSDLNLSDEDRALVIGLEELQELGRQLKDEKPTLIEERIAATGPDDLATVIYTSGTTGTPKGAMITHGNIAAILEDLKVIIPVGAADVYLAYLPLSHVFERICGEFYCMQSGGVYSFAEGIEHMSKNLAEVQPTMVLVVPRVLERIYNKVKAGIDASPKNKKALAEWAINVGKEMLQYRSNAQEPGLMLKAKHYVATRLVLTKIKEKIGSRLTCIISGGAPATKEILEFFNALGIPTLEGYGLTETTAPLTVNRFDRIKLGTVGTALPCVELKLAEDGEILAKGASVFKGYYRAEEATKEVFDEEGYFRTGDIGQLDADGYVKITDRKKDIIVNSSGKNIAPQKIEAMLRTIPHVSQAVIFGDKKKTLVALLTLDEQAISDYGRNNGWHFVNFEQLSNLPELKKYLRKEIQARSNKLADYERVRNFAILKHDFSIDGGELTASMKIRRNVVRDKYKKTIETLYKDEAEDTAFSTPAPGVATVV
ncbi:MAG: long-chain fatty acid--CoA ligase [Candidatus Obscuribacterales bacterium]|nr:long-chain fatty acid--CoA ligase [Candidatus Obscuribacterales bacterium]